MSHTDCQKCALAIPVNGEYLKCQTCQLKFHADCGKKSIQDFQKMSRKAKKSWKCEGCRKSVVNKYDVLQDVVEDRIDNPDLSSDKSKSDESKDSTTEMHKNIGDIKTKLSQLDCITAKLESFEKAVKFCSDQADEQSTNIKELISEVRLLRQENTHLKDENRDLAIQVQQLSKDLNALDQYGRRNNLEIHGVPSIKDESTDDIIFAVANALRVPLNSTDIEASHRLNTNGNGPQPIIVRFVNRRVKEHLMHKRRTTKHLSANDINQSFSKNAPIYLNENLTSSNRKLLGLARAKRNEAGFQFAWFSRDNVFVRLNENSPAVCIRDKADFDHFLEEAQRNRQARGQGRGKPLASPSHQNRSKDQERAQAS